MQHFEIILSLIAAIVVAGPVCVQNCSGWAVWTVFVASAVCIAPMTMLSLARSSEEIRATMIASGVLITVTIVLGLYMYGDENLSYAVLGIAMVCIEIGLFLAVSRKWQKVEQKKAALRLSCNVTREPIPVR